MRLFRLLPLAALGCSRPAPSPARPSAIIAAATTRDDSVLLASRPPRGEVRAARSALTPLADSIDARLVLAPTTQRWFVAAARGKRMLVDLGRVDVDVRKDAARLAAYRLAVAARSPVTVGSRLRLFGPWGTDTVVLSGFDAWNGRIVALVTGSSRVDSLARRVDPLIASAVVMDTTARADTTARSIVVAVADTGAATRRAPAAARSEDSCDRTASPGLLVRAKVVRDSLEASLRATAMPPYERLASVVKVRSSQVAGCFGAERLALAVTLWTGDYAWVQERVVLLDTLGRVVPMRLADYRFKAHDLVAAFDADGDGHDDLAARGAAAGMGGTTILRRADRTHLTRLASGFAWEVVE